MILWNIWDGFGAILFVSLLWTTSKVFIDQEKKKKKEATSYDGI